MHATSTSINRLYILSGNNAASALLDPYAVSVLGVDGCQWWGLGKGGYVRCQAVIVRM